MDLMRLGFGRFKTKVPRMIGSSEGICSGSGELSKDNRSSRCQTGKSWGTDHEMVAHGRRKNEVSSKLILRQGCTTPSAFNMASFESVVTKRVGEARGAGGWS